MINSYDITCKKYNKRKIKKELCSLHKIKAKLFTNKYYRQGDSPFALLWREAPRGLRDRLMSYIAEKIVHSIKYNEEYDSKHNKRFYMTHYISNTL